MGDPVLLTPDHASVPSNLPGEVKPEGEGPEKPWGLPPGFSTDELGHIKPIVMTLPDDRFPPGFVPRSPYIAHPHAMAEPSFGAFNTTTNNALGLMAGPNSKQHHHHDNAHIYTLPPGPGSTHHHSGEHFFSPMPSGYRYGMSLVSTFNALMKTVSALQIKVHSLSCSCTLHCIFRMIFRMIWNLLHVTFWM
jgi:hypothetical protein